MAAVSKQMRAAVESFVNYAATKLETHENFEAAGIEAPKSAGRQAVVSLVTTMLFFAALLVAGKWLWNKVLAELFTCVKPVKSVWQLLGLSILLGMVLPGGGGGCC